MSPRLLRSSLLFISVFAVTNAGFGSYSSTMKTARAENSGLYEKLQLEKAGLKEAIFLKAVRGYLQLMNASQVKRPEVLSIADFSQSSNQKRLYVIDMAAERLLYNTYVAHGRNSGEEFATAFANKPQSYKSSLGFYLTGDIYTGQHGTSLRLKGCERGINDKAECRGIVIHGASYVSCDFIEKHGRLGRSQGCPALPEELSEPIINTIKEGSCFFIYAADNSYLSRSQLAAAEND